jgi:putative salt-induced outer membrane protein
VKVRAGFALLALLVTAPGVCQDEEDEGPITGKAALGYLSTSGNTESTNANASFNLVWQKPIWGHEFDLSAIKAETGGVTTAESYSSAYTGRREFSEKSYMFTALDHERNEFSAYDEQVSETVGYGRRLIQTDRHAFSAEGGIGARQASLRNGVDEDEGIVRLKADYTWTISDTTEFGQDLVVESGSSNTSTEAVSELRARLFGEFSLVLSYRIKSNSDVLPGTEKTDRFTAISIEYAF